MRILKTSTLAGFCLILLLSLAGNVFAEPQTKCPVMGGDINKDIYADYEGKRVYFCCAACVPQFEADPEKYLAKLKEMGVEPETVPTEDGDATPDDADPAEHAAPEGHADHSEDAK